MSASGARSKFLPKAESFKSLPTGQASGPEVARQAYTKTFAQKHGTDFTNAVQGTSRGFLDRDFGGKRPKFAAQSFSSGWRSGGDRGESNHAASLPGLSRTQSDFGSSPDDYQSVGNGSVGRSCTLTDYFSDNGRLRVRPTSFTSTLLLPPLHYKTEQQVARSPAKTYHKAKLKYQTKALEDDHALQLQQLAEMHERRQSRDATEPVLQSRLDHLFAGLQDWANLVPEVVEPVTYDDPGLRFQLKESVKEKAPTPPEDPAKPNAKKKQPNQTPEQLEAFALDEEEQALLLESVQKAVIIPDSMKAKESQGIVLRPTFCRWLLDLEVCDQENLHYHWCVAMFDEYSESSTSTPHRYVTFEAFLELMTVLFGKRFAASTKDQLFGHHMDLAELEAKQRRFRFRHLCHRYAENQHTRSEIEEKRLLADPVMSQLRSWDVTRQYPPMGMTAQEYSNMVEELEENGSSVKPKATEQERRANGETKLAVQLEVLDMLCEPEAIHFMQKFTPLLQKLFDTYHDMSEDRVRSLLPGRDRPSTLGSLAENDGSQSPPSRKARPTRVQTHPPRLETTTSSATQPSFKDDEVESRDQSPKTRGLSEGESDAKTADSTPQDEEPIITGHMNFPCFVQFCSDFQLFPKLAGYAELRFLYETAVSCELPRCRGDDEMVAPRSRDRRVSRRTTTHNTYVSQERSTAKLPLFEKEPEERTYAEAKAFEILNALCDWMDARIGRVQDVFALFDTDRSWTISAEEFATGINQMHIKPVPSEEEIEEILQIVDNNYDGMIQLAELERAITATMAYRKEEAIQKAQRESRISLKVNLAKKSEDEDVKPDLGMGGPPAPNTDAVAMRFLKLEDNSNQHYPRQIDVPFLNGKMNLCVDTSRPPSPQPPAPPPPPETPTEKKKDAKRNSKRASSFGDGPKTVERKSSMNSNRASRSDSMGGIEKQSTRRSSTAAEPEVEPPSPVAKNTTDKRWRIFGPAAFSEVLLRIAVEYLTFHGNPVQQRCSAYSKGLWLLAHLNNVFQDVAENHKNRPVSPTSTSFVRPLHSLVWDVDGPELFRRYPKGSPLPASVTNPKVDDDDLSEDELPEVGYGNDSAFAEKPPSNTGSEKPNSGFGSRSTSSKGGARSKSSRGVSRERGNGQVSAAAATMRALDQRQRQERLIEEARQKHSRKVEHATQRRREYWGSNWGSPHSWKTSIVDRHYIYPPKASAEQPYLKLTRRQSKTHTYLLTVEKWLSTMGPAQDYWMTPQQLILSSEKTKKSVLMSQKSRKTVR
jgi:hypothetical protein